LYNSKIDKLFVYGSLLQGEERGNALKEWQLTGAMEIPGTLYNTGLGYPAADFSYNNHNTVFGELYTYEKDKIDSRLKNIDKIEGVDEYLFKRTELNLGEHIFYAYEIAPSLNKISDKFNIITSGNWRQNGSLSLTDSSTFAINFENIQSQRYRSFTENDFNTFIHIKGNRPLLIVSSHATCHIRKGKIKAQEQYTGAISVILNSLLGVHSLYTIYATELDSNYCRETSLKEYIRELVNLYNIKFVIDIHGTGIYRKFDLYPGIGKHGEFLNGKSFLISELERILLKNNISLGGTDVFPAYRQYTISRFVNSELGVPSMQIEINQKYRSPESDNHLFEKLIYSLAEYIESIKNSI
jgi:gamma-glutamylcyclotransferase (GGCT)/AIG2-like uncharacterized protein YtfP